MAQTKTALGQNIEAILDGNTLTLKIDLSKDFGKSKSGKTTIVATTNGFAAIGAVKIGLNVIK